MLAIYASCTNQTELAIERIDETKMEIIISSNRIAINYEGAGPL